MEPELTKTDALNLKTYALPEDVGQAIVQYLSTRPYREVATIMEALAGLREIALGPQSGRTGDVSPQEGSEH